MATMKIHQIFFKNQLRNFCYLIEFDDGAIYCIDPFHSTLVLDSLKNTFKGRHLAGIINTHDHCDHYSGNADLVARFQCPVMAHLNASPPHKTKNLVDREVIHQCNEWALLALDTPGHTMSHVCLLLEKNARPFAIFTGDCFFNAGVGNCHNGGDPEVLYETICNVFEKLSDDVLVYPGHEYLKRNLEFTQFYEPDNVAAKEFLEK
ncbi:MAG: MBL fold metallo-hydrolase, partial [Bacteriovorax sp.]